SHYLSKANRMAKKPPSAPPINADQTELAAVLARLEAEQSRRKDFKDGIASGRLIEVRGVEDSVATVVTGVPRAMEIFAADDEVAVSRDADNTTSPLGKPDADPPRRRDHAERLPPPPKITQGPQRIDTVVESGEATGMPDRVVSVWYTVRDSVVELTKENAGLLDDGKWKRTLKAFEPAKRVAEEMARERCGLSTPFHSGKLRYHKPGMI